jgi:UDP-glucose 4-epimerase
VPDHPRLRFQAVHSLDVGDAYRRAILATDARGAFNVAAEPVIGPAELGQVLHARPVKVPAALLRAGAAGAYALRLTPTEPGWLDMALAVPLMDTGRARHELGWTPQHQATDTLAELLAGMRAGAELDTPPLARGTTAPARLRELLTGIGARQ